MSPFEVLTAAYFQGASKNSVFVILSTPSFENRQWKQTEMNFFTFKNKKQIIPVTLLNVVESIEMHGL